MTKQTKVIKQINKKLGLPRRMTHTVFCYFLGTGNPLNCVYNNYKNNGPKEANRSNSYWLVQVISFSYLVPIGGFTLEIINSNNQ